jgi:hypothetical protein
VTATKPGAICHFEFLHEREILIRNSVRTADIQEPD